METGLDTLLDLDGTTYRLDSGYWVKFEARRVTATAQRPHGVTYSLTLHDCRNLRVMGFDNAHGCPTPRRHKFSGRRIAWDHRHSRTTIAPYGYESAAQLPEDFWVEVERVTGGVSS